MDKLVSMSSHLDFVPTSEQKQALDDIERFLKLPIHNTFILKGAAGTGKTSILKAVVGYLSYLKTECILLAPTGRAAKILSDKSGNTAGTIHSHIYIVNEVKDDAGAVLFIEFIRRNNISEKAAVYIIDEASMVGDLINNTNTFVSTKSLLEDLIGYIKDRNKNNKIIFVGDPYQLPPINSTMSPALDEDYLTEKFKQKCTSFELFEVKRQNKESYILENAINLRKQIINNSHKHEIKFESFYEERQAIIQYCTDITNGKANKSIFLAWRNISINSLNKQIRNLLYNTTNPMVVGERLVINQTNYTGGYIPSGTIVVVDQIVGTVETIADLDFVTVKIKNANTNELIAGDFKIDLHTLTSEKGYMEPKMTKKLWHERYRSNKELQKTKDSRVDEYLSALKVRYAYAITTHKAQGGEWGKVYLYPETPFGISSLRWLYTSVTRAKNHLYSFIIT